MPIQYTDQQILGLIAESKSLPKDWRSRLSLKTKGAYRRAELEVLSDVGNKFRIMLREATANPLDFSAVLAIQPQATTRMFLLRRYNGRSHRHRNPLEGTNLQRGFHIHEATERYQAQGLREEHYAAETDRYDSLGAALDCMIGDCGFKEPQSDQALLDFGGPA